MCGIAGVLNYSNEKELVHSAQIEKMCKVIAHRGPDGQGVFIDSNLGLGHRRLSIIDLSNAASQPLQDQTGRYVISYNGEVYNYRELRDDLLKLGHVFQSASDTEVILESYKQWGLDFLEKLNGIFTFAIWDKIERSLLVARDPVGIKPLFFYDNHKTFIFGSEVKAVLANSQVSRAIDPKALDNYFSFNYMPAPQTLLREVTQLLPGHFLLFKNGRKTEGTFGSLSNRSHNESKLTFDDELATFTEKFQKTVHNQTVADVPVGSFLSGGLDSTAVAVALKQSVKSFTFQYEI